MATITEDYVGFETAKLLKEKGFDESCYQKYDDEGYLSFNHVGYINSDKPCDDFYALAPTLQMAMKWLRKVHNWTICISPYWPEGDMRNKLAWYYDIHSLIDSRSFRESSYTDSYTKACEAAIKYCLKNLL